MLESRQSIIRKLQADILDWQGITPAQTDHIHVAGLEAIESAFPNAVFPVGALHEFISAEPEQLAACGGFIAGLLASLMLKDNLCLWIGINRQLFPPSLTVFGISPDHILFVDASNDQEVLWAAEEGLKCSGIAAVVAELTAITTGQSRRLQLAAEQHHTLCLLLRTSDRAKQSSLCSARWQIKPVPSRSLHGMPGLGFPRWEVELLKVRNGNPGSWLVEWYSNRFTIADATQQLDKPVNRKAG